MLPAPPATTRTPRPNIQLQQSSFSPPSTILSTINTFTTPSHVVPPHDMLYHHHMLYRPYTSHVVPLHMLYHLTTCCTITYPLTCCTTTFRTLPKRRRGECGRILWTTATRDRTTCTATPPVPWLKARRNNSRSSCSCAHAPSAPFDPRNNPCTALSSPGCPSPR